MSVTVVPVNERLRQVDSFDDKERLAKSGGTTSALRPEIDEGRFCFPLKAGGNIHVRY